MAGMIKGGAIYMPTGSGKAGFVDVRDIAAVAARVLTETGHGGRAYEITGPEALDYAQVAAIFSRVLGREVKHVDVPPDAAKASLMQAGLPEWLAQAINELSDAMKQGVFERTTNVVRDVGKKEPITLGQFVREHEDAFR
jgi:uncharacterized protein YbjT (DUF2867 family)